MCYILCSPFLVWLLDTSLCMRMPESVSLKISIRGKIKENRKEKKKLLLFIDPRFSKKFYAFIPNN